MSGSARVRGAWGWPHGGGCGAVGTHRNSVSIEMCSSPKCTGSLRRNIIIQMTVSGDSRPRGVTEHVRPRVDNTRLESPAIGPMACSMDTMQPCTVQLVHIMSLCAILEPMTAICTGQPKRPRQGSTPRGHASAAATRVTPPPAPRCAGGRAREREYALENT